MAGNALQHLADVEEIDIAFRRPNGSTGSTPIWVVLVGEDVFVRSIRGLRGGWYRRLLADPDGEVRDSRHAHPVRAEPVADEGTLAEVTAAYRAKYGGSPYVQPLLEEANVPGTMRLQPR
jgi:hypothetical protein